MHLSISRATANSTEYRPPGISRSRPRAVGIAPPQFAPLRLQPVSRTSPRIGPSRGLAGRRNRSEPLFGSAQPNCRGWGGPLSTGLGDILQFEVRSDRMCKADESETDACHTPMKLREVLDWFVAYQVEVLPDRLRALDVSLGTLFEALERNNATAGGGYLVRAGEQLLVRGEGRIQSLDEIGDVLIETREDGVPVRVRDVARVRFAPLIRQGAVTRDGRGEAVTGIVMMLVGANGRAVVEDVKIRINEIGSSLPEGVYLDVFYDRADLVNRTIRTVATNLAEGALFVIAVLFVLLGSIRGGLIVAAAIPFAMLVAFIGMEAFGLSGNLMSLGAIDFGIVVDGSIIVVENAVVHMAAAARKLGRPMSYREAADVDFEDALSYSGLRQTTRMGSQLRVFPDQRSGWRRRAAS